jgi:putative nucleotidyltransferase with HDIG domain
MREDRLSPAFRALIEAAERTDRAGQREIARRRYETALYLLRGHDGLAASLILRRVAHSYIDDGQLDLALDCLEAALGVAEANNDKADIAHATNLIGNVHLLRGEFEAAEPMYARALALAQNAGEAALEAMVLQNLGVVASMRDDLAAALEHYGSSLAICRSAGLHRQVGHLLNNMGLVYTQLDQLAEAQAAYEESVVHCRAAGDTPNRLLATVNSANLWLARGEVDRADALCREVVAEAQEVGHHRALGEAFKHLGVISRARGEMQRAQAHFDAAYENAMVREDLLLAAETAREQAELFELMSKNRETLQALSRSHSLFSRLRSRRRLADLQRRVSRLEDRFYVVVARWARTIESKDSYTHGHCERVASYASALARDIGFDEMTMFWFSIGALLHDVGKVVVPSEILNKPGRLTDDERRVMERHAAAGAELLADIEFPWDILPMIRGHHERWDGRGYPDGLAGEDISLSARIICVADVFDALTTDRPYRRGFAREKALEIMAADRGAAFDPAIFDRFLYLIQDPALYQEPDMAAAS